MEDLFSVKDSVIVVTGANGLLGRQFSAELESRGALIIGFDQKDTPAVNIVDEDSVRTAVKRVFDEHGRIDGLIHCAAMDAVPGGNQKQSAAYHEFDFALWEREVQVNLSGSFLVTKHVAKHMMEARNGSIVFVSSDLGLIAPNNTIYEPGNFKDIAYVSSKSGVIGLMRAWASYLGPYNVNVNALVPGGVYNNQSPQFVEKNVKLNMKGRMANENEYNGAVVFLCSKASSYMTGATLVLDGGRTAW
ncbi:MAG: SDR family oxidoreductase [Leptospiraceae bacterium]